MQLRLVSGDTKGMRDAACDVSRAVFYLSMHSRHRESDVLRITPRIECTGAIGALPSARRTANAIVPPSILGSTVHGIDRGGPDMDDVVFEEMYRPVIGRQPAEAFSSG